MAITDPNFSKALAAVIRELDLQAMGPEARRLVENSRRAYEQASPAERKLPREL